MTAVSVNPSKLRGMTIKIEPWVVEDIRVFICLADFVYVYPASPIFDDSTMRQHSSPNKGIVALVVWVKDYVVCEGLYQRSYFLLILLEFSLISEGCDTITFMSRKPGRLVLVVVTVLGLFDFSLFT